MDQYYCGNSQCNLQFGPCSCSIFHNTTSTTSTYLNNSSSYSMLFPTLNSDHHPNYYTYDHDHQHSSSFSSSSVDCTLSLGTPSTRLNRDHKPTSTTIWNIFNTNQQPPLSSTHPKGGSGGGGGGGGGGKGGGGNISNNTMNGDTLLASRRCANCDTTSTPLWRNGPRGPKSLCNACGIRYKKEERRAANTTTANNNNGVTGSGSMKIDHPQYSKGHQYLWVPQQQHHHLGNEFMFIQEDDHRDSDNGIPFLSWRLNIPERSTLIHDYTC